MHTPRTTTAPLRRRTAVVVSALVLGLVVSACGGDTGSEQDATPSPAQSTEATPDSTGTTPDSTESTEAPTDGTETTAGDEVVISGFVFEPASIEVAAGTRVRWTNEDMFAHTVTSGQPGGPTGQFDGDLGELDNVDASGTTFDTAFTEPGTYPYFCRFHPKMRGEVVVVP